VQAVDDPQLRYSGSQSGCRRKELLLALFRFDAAALHFPEHSVELPLSIRTFMTLELKSFHGPALLFNALPKRGQLVVLDCCQDTLPCVDHYPSDTMALPNSACLCGT